MALFSCVILILEVDESFLLPLSTKMINTNNINNKLKTLMTVDSDYKYKILYHDETVVYSYIVQTTFKMTSCAFNLQNMM